MIYYCVSELSLKWDCKWKKDRNNDTYLPHQWRKIKLHTNMVLALYIVTSLLAIGGCGNHGTFQSRTFHLVKPAYLSMKEGSLFCFVCHAEISQAMVLHVTLLISLESSQWVGVHWLGFGLRLFGATVWKLLIIEAFSQWKLNKMKTENCIGIWGSSWCHLGVDKLQDLKQVFLFPKAQR